ncbi:MAG TPA: type II toxin-antitoxin system RelE/ParE family toxin [Bryobacteraceae bacterium]|nr:type II toxin-antitoxin system RelE/ParE family toxin [Bryobacteraceae bacterium]
MNGYILSPEARHQIFEIWSYLAAKAGIDLANQVESELFGDLALLARNPGIGHKRRDLAGFAVLFYRAFPYQYMIIYRARMTVSRLWAFSTRSAISRRFSVRK